MLKVDKRMVKRPQAKLRSGCSLKLSLHPEAGLLEVQMVEFQADLRHADEESNSRATSSGPS
jgi:hypothetical protein